MSPQAEAAPAHARDRDSYTAFSGLWAVATLFHIVSVLFVHEWSLEWLLRTILLAAAALAVLHRPSSAPRLVILAVLQLQECWIESPYISNHLLVTALVNLTLLIALVMLVLKHGRLSIDRGEWFDAFAPAVRIELLVLYFFAVFHKLNADFFSSQGCGASFYVGFAQQFPFLPRSSALQAASTYLAFGIEAAIPLLLCFRVTRSLGTVIGVLFHAAIAFVPFSGFYNFSSMMVALLFLFTPRGLASDFRRRWKDARSGFSIQRWTAASSSQAALLLYGALAATCILLLTLGGMRITGRNVILTLWGLYSVLLLGTFVALSISDREKVGHEGNPFAPAHPAFWIVPALMVFNGMNPYLGLKTETSFAMFSNLRTEGGRSNHFLVPASVQLFDFQHDLVEVTDSSDRFLRYVARDRGLIPYFELRARLSRAPMASVSYIRNGEKVSVERAADDPELARAIPYLARKLLHFRVVNGTGREGCRH